jgi:hypothetical protein
MDFEQVLHRPVEITRVTGQVPFFAGTRFTGNGVNQDLSGAVARGLLLDGLVALPAEIEYSDDVNTDHEEHERQESRAISN